MSNAQRPFPTQRYREMAKSDGIGQRLRQIATIPRLTKTSRGSPTMITAHSAGLTIFTAPGAKATLRVALKVWAVIQTSSVLITSGAAEVAATTAAAAARIMMGAAAVLRS